MILFSDFDKTLYFKDDEARARANLEAARGWREAGHKFCITTGRSYRSVTTEMPELKELCDYYIVDSGSIVLSREGELLHAFYFEPEVVAGIVDVAKSWVEAPTPLFYTPDYEGVDYTAERVTKLRLWFEDLRLMSGIAEKLEKSFPVFVVFTDGKSRHRELDGKNGFVEIVPVESGKNHAIEFLQKTEGILAEDIVTVGDSANDYAMVREFGGFVIEGSELADAYPELETVPSVAALVEEMFNSTAKEIL